MEVQLRKGVNAVDMNTPISSDELKHHGIKGQKWGVRKYQNKDGSLTPEGIKRYGNKDNFDKQYPEDAKKKKIEDLTKSQNVLKKTNDVTKYAKDTQEKQISKKQKMMDAAVEAQIRDRVYKMSDEDLRNAVNRINMEERYTQVMQYREHVEVGKSKADKFMDVTLKTLKIAEYAIPIALAFYGVANNKK